MKKLTENLVSALKGREELVNKYHEILHKKYYEFKYNNADKHPEKIIMHVKAWETLKSFPYFDMASFMNVMELRFMGIKVIRTYDIEEGEFSIF